MIVQIGIFAAALFFISKAYLTIIEYYGHLTHVFVTPLSLGGSQTLHNEWPLCEDDLEESNYSLN